jgi:HTH-type transcriptional regulator, transcriptional repressor of NAD biosynthesis genes
MGLVSAAVSIVLVVGKFLPPHAGHAYLIDHALTLAGATGTVHVMVNDRPAYAIPAEVRAAWLLTDVPRLSVHVANDPWAGDDADGQAGNIVRILGRAPDIIVTSETWADAVSERLGCAHVQLDPPRTAVPISATMVRDDPIGSWSMLMPSARAGLCRRVCFVGAESTGKTTLSRALADRWNTEWVPEYGRDHTIEKQELGTNDTWTTDDFIVIADRQQHLEDERARRSGPVLLCDTDALATGIWHERYQGERSAAVDAIARRRTYGLYVLAGTDVPWEPDDIRLGTEQREWMQQRFRDELTHTGATWIEVRGSVDERIALIEADVDTRGWLTPDGVFAPSRWT